MINVAGHRLGTREIEESISSHPDVSEVAVVGVEDKLKGQVAVAFVIPKDAAAMASPESTRAMELAVMAVVDRQLGAVARPLQAICEGRDAGDLTTIEDPASLVQIREALGQP